MLVAVAAAHWCGSPHIAKASRVSGAIYVGSILLWAADPGGHVWPYAILDLFALLYFFQKWSSREAHHRQFHFLMMLSYLASTSFYAFRSAVAALPISAFAMSEWWHVLFSNLLFELELAFIFIYALLHRRARADRRKFRSEVEQWFARAAKGKRDNMGGR